MQRKEVLADNLSKGAVSVVTRQAGIAQKAVSMIAPMPAEMREMADCEMDCRTGPLWLSALLQARFFTTCKAHASSGKSDKNMFCIDCAEDCCPSCVPQEHEGHHVIQIRRSSYHEAVRVSDIQKLIDYTQVQLYVINSARLGVCPVSCSGLFSGLVILHNAAQRSPLLNV